jgi:hypothetical protein
MPGYTTGLIRMRTGQLAGQRVGQEQDRARQKEEEARRIAEEDRQRQIKRDALQTALLERQINAPPAPRNIDPLSPEGVAAQLKLSQGRAQAEASAPSALPRPTEQERKAAFFLEGVEDAVSRLRDFKPMSGASAIAAQTPIVGNYFLDGETQAALQAAEVLHDAYLRMTTGATIQGDELRQAARQYVPLPGDKPEVVAMKERRRDQVLRAFENMAGPAVAHQQRNAPQGRASGPGPAGQMGGGGGGGGGTMPPNLPPLQPHHIEKAKTDAAFREFLRKKGYPI